MTTIQTAPAAGGFVPTEGWRDDLYQAVWLGQRDTVRAMIGEARGFDLRHLDLDEDGNPQTTHLMNAIMRGHGGVAAELLAAGVDVNATDADGASALHFAVHFQADTEMLRLLLAAGPALDVRDGENGRSPLGSLLFLDYNTTDPAVHRPRVMEKLAMLLAAGADPNATDRSGMGVLSITCTQCWCPAVEPLLAAGADPTAACASGYTASDYFGNAFKRGGLYVKDVARYGGLLGGRMAGGVYTSNTGRGYAR